MIRDVRYALRSLARSRGFSIAAIATLSIGIGAATAIYSVVDTILLQPLPFAGGDRLVRLVEYAPFPTPGRAPFQRGLSYPEYLEWRGRSKTLVDASAVIGMSQRMVRTPDGAAGLWGVMVSGNTFGTLQARAMLGRTFTTADESNPDVAVISHDVWRRHYHSDPSIVGTVLELHAGALLAAIPPRALTIVGVMPETFEFPTGTFDFFAPIVTDQAIQQRAQVTMIARLAPGVSLQAATADATLMGTAIRPPWPAASTPPVGPRFEVQNLKERAVAPLRPALRILLAAVVVVLLIVCANVANLMLARGTLRQREIAVRLAIGASRRQIIGQVLTESVVLAVAGGILGVLLGAGGVAMVKQLATVDAPGIFRLMFGSTILPRANEVGVSWRLLGISFSISAIACVAFGLLPAIHISRINHLQALAARGINGSHNASRVRAALVVGQLALATLLLVAAGLLGSSFVRLSTFNKGYDPAHVLAFNLLFPDSYSAAHKGETIATLLARFRAKPGVLAAGFARHGLLMGEELHIGQWVPPGKTLGEMTDYPFRVRSISSGFLTAMGVPLLAGRDLSPGDDAAMPIAIVINQSAAHRFSGDPIGQVVDWQMGKWIFRATVAGVVADVHQRQATDALVPEIFVDYRQYMKVEGEIDPAAAERRQNEAAIGFLSFAVRSAGDPGAMVPVVRGAINDVDPNIGIDAIAPMTDLEASSTARERFYAVMLGVFASVAAILASIGIYGVLTYAVAQRTREFGIRMALGARRSEVIALVLRRGLILTVIGVAIGLAGAAAAARYLQSMLFGVQPLDPITFAQVAVAFSMVAAMASYLPARRATAVDPVVALRHD